ncbi:MAG: restriction endonuclease subunit S [Patescibacteria group bacterium]
MNIRLGAVCRILNGFPFDSDRFVSEGGFPLIRIRDLKTNSPSVRFVGEFDEMFVIKRGTLLVGMDGEFRCYEWKGSPALLNQRVCALQPEQNLLDRDYLKYWISQELLRIEDTTAFTTVKHLSSRDLLALPIPLPTIVDQRKIASHLNDQLNAISIGSSGIATQVELATTFPEKVLNEAFSGFVPLGIQGVKRNQMASWTWHSLTSVARLESGHTPSRRHPEWWGGKIPWLALPDIRKLHGKHAYETTENTNDAGLANSSARVLPAGTVCVSRTASIGFATILGKPMATSQDFCNWVCDPDKLDPEFLMYAVMASQDALRELGSGAVHKTIYMPTIKSFHICAPDIAEQRRIARTLCDRLAAAESLIAGLKARLADIERLPQRLLAAAFSHS